LTIIVARERGRGGIGFGGGTGQEQPHGGGESKIHACFLGGKKRGMCESPQDDVANPTAAPEMPVEFLLRGVEGAISGER
jgi:hypothetical protein